MTKIKDGKNIPNRREILQANIEKYNSGKR